MKLVFYACTFFVHFQNWFVFWGNAPGFVLSIWLNMAAAKLQYCDRMSNNMRSSFVRLLESNRGSFVIREDQTADMSTEQKATEEVENNITHSQGGVTSFENMRTMALEIATGRIEAPAPHEKVVVAVITIWVAIITTICFLDVEMTQKKLIIGIAVNINLLFFYGAPLSTIFTVLKTRDSSSIHRWTMLMNTANATFWTAFGFGTSDYFIMVPNGIGAILGVMQMILRVVVPSNGVTENVPSSIENHDMEMATPVPSTGSGETGSSSSAAR
jgi:solute carrier family 50 protein (sugar transporter)